MVLWLHGCSPKDHNFIRISEKCLAILVLEHQDRWIRVARGNHHKFAGRYYVDDRAAAAYAASEGSSSICWRG